MKKWFMTVLAAVAGALFSLSAIADGNQTDATLVYPTDLLLGNFDYKPDGKGNKIDEATRVWTIKQATVKATEDGRYFIPARIIGPSFLAQNSTDYLTNLKKVTLDISGTINNDFTNGAVCARFILGGEYSDYDAPEVRGGATILNYRPMNFPESSDNVNDYCSGARQSSATGKLVASYDWLIPLTPKLLNAAITKDGKGKDYVIYRLMADFNGGGCDDIWYVKIYIDGLRLVNENGLMVWPKSSLITFNHTQNMFTLADKCKTNDMAQAIASNCSSNIANNVSYSHAPQTYATNSVVDGTWPLQTAGDFAAVSVLGNNGLYNPATGAYEGGDEDVIVLKDLADTDNFRFIGWDCPTNGFFRAATNEMAYFTRGNFWAGSTVVFSKWDRFRWFVINDVTGETNKCCTLSEALDKIAALGSTAKTLKPNPYFYDNNAYCVRDITQDFGKNTDSSAFFPFFTSGIRALDNGYDTAFIISNDNTTVDFTWTNGVSHINLAQTNFFGHAMAQITVVGATNVVLRGIEFGDYSHSFASYPFFTTGNCPDALSITNGAEVLVDNCLGFRDQRIYITGGSTVTMTNSSFTTQTKPFVVEVENGSELALLANTKIVAEYGSDVLPGPLEGGVRAVKAHDSKVTVEDGAQVVGGQWQFFPMGYSIVSNIFLNTKMDSALVTNVEYKIYDQRTYNARDCGSATNWSDITRWGAYSNQVIYADMAGFGIRCKTHCKPIYWSTTCMSTNGDEVAAALCAEAPGLFTAEGNALVYTNKVNLYLTDDPKKAFFFDANSNAVVAARYYFDESLCNNKQDSNSACDSETVIYSHGNDDDRTYCNYRLIWATDANFSKVCTVHTKPLYWSTDSAFAEAHSCYEDYSGLYLVTLDVWAYGQGTRELKPKGGWGVNGRPTVQLYLNYKQDIGIAVIDPDFKWYDFRNGECTVACGGTGYFCGHDDIRNFGATNYLMFAASEAEGRCPNHTKRLYWSTHKMLAGDSDDAAGVLAANPAITGMTKIVTLHLAKGEENKFFTDDSKLVVPYSDLYGKEYKLVDTDGVCGNRGDTGDSVTCRCTYDGYGFDEDNINAWGSRYYVNNGSQDTRWNHYYDFGDWAGRLIVQSDSNYGKRCVYHAHEVYWSHIDQGLVYRTAKETDLIPVPTTNIVLYLNVEQDPDIVDLGADYYYYDRWTRNSCDDVYKYDDASLPLTSDIFSTSDGWLDAFNGAIISNLVASTNACSPDFDLRDTNHCHKLYWSFARMTERSTEGDAIDNFIRLKLAEMVAAGETFPFSKTLVKRLDHDITLTGRGTGIYMSGDDSVLTLNGGVIGGPLTTNDWFWYGTQYGARGWDGINVQGGKLTVPATSKVVVNVGNNAITIGNDVDATNVTINAGQFRGYSWGKYTYDWEKEIWGYTDELWNGSAFDYYMTLGNFLTVDSILARFSGWNYGHEYNQTEGALFKPDVEDHNKLLRDNDLRWSYCASNAVPYCYYNFENPELTPDESALAPYGVFALKDDDALTNLEEVVWGSTNLDQRTILFEGTLTNQIVYKAAEVTNATDRYQARLGITAPEGIDGWNYDSCKTQALDRAIKYIVKDYDLVITNAITNTTSYVKDEYNDILLVNKAFDDEVLGTTSNGYNRVALDWYPTVSVEEMYTCASNRANGAAEKAGVTYIEREITVFWDGMEPGAGGRSNTYKVIFDPYTTVLDPYTTDAGDRTFTEVCSGALTWPREHEIAYYRLGTTNFTSQAWEEATNTNFVTVFNELDAITNAAWLAQNKLDDLDDYHFVGWDLFDAALTNEFGYATNLIICAESNTTHQIPLYTRTCVASVARWQPVLFKTFDTNGEEIVEAKATDLYRAIDNAKDGETVKLNANCVKTNGIVQAGYHNAERDVAHQNLIPGDEIYPKLSGVSQILIEGEKNITLDLSGKELFVDAAISNPVFIVKAGSTLTIQNGTIRRGGSSPKYRPVLNDRYIAADPSGIVRVEEGATLNVINAKLIAEGKMVDFAATGASLQKGQRSSFISTDAVVEVRGTVFATNFVFESHNAAYALHATGTNAVFQGICGEIVNGYEPRPYNMSRAILTSSGVQKKTVERQVELQLKEAEITLMEQARDTGIGFQPVTLLAEAGAQVDLTQVSVFGADDSDRWLEADDQVPEVDFAAVVACDSSTVVTVTDGSISYDWANKNWNEVYSNKFDKIWFAPRAVKALDGATATFFGTRIPANGILAYGSDTVVTLAEGTYVKGFTPTKVKLSPQEELIPQEEMIGPVLQSYHGVAFSENTVDVLAGATLNVFTATLRNDAPDCNVIYNLGGFLNVFDGADIGQGGTMPAGDEWEGFISNTSIRQESINDFQPAFTLNGGQVAGQTAITILGGKFIAPYMPVNYVWGESNEVVEVTNVVNTAVVIGGGMGLQLLNVTNAFGAADITIEGGAFLSGTWEKLDVGQWVFNGSGSALVSAGKYGYPAVTNFLTVAAGTKILESLGGEKYMTTGARFSTEFDTAFLTSGLTAAYGIDVSADKWYFALPQMYDLTWDYDGGNKLKDYLPQASYTVIDTIELPDTNNVFKAGYELVGWAVYDTDEGYLIGTNYLYETKVLKGSDFLRRLTFVAVWDLLNEVYLVDGQEYNSWDEAYAAAGDGATIKLTTIDDGEEFTLDAPLVINKNITLDLNGKKLNRNFPAADGALVQVTADVTAAKIDNGSIYDTYAPVIDIAVPEDVTKYGFVLGADLTVETTMEDCPIAIGGVRGLLTAENTAAQLICGVTDKKALIAMFDPLCANGYAYDTDTFTVKAIADFDRPQLFKEQDILGGPNATLETLTPKLNTSYDGWVNLNGGVAEKVSLTIGKKDKYGRVALTLKRTVKGKTVSVKKTVKASELTDVTTGAKTIDFGDIWLTIGGCGIICNNTEEVFGEGAEFFAQLKRFGVKDDMIAPVQLAQFQGNWTVSLPAVFVASNTVSDADIAKDARKGTSTYFANGMATFKLTVGKKGKVTVKGYLPDGKSVSTTAQLISGDGICCAPIVIDTYTKKQGGLAFTVWFKQENTTSTIVRDVCQVSDLSAWKTDTFVAEVGDVHYREWVSVQRVTGNVEDVEGYTFDSGAITNFTDMIAGQVTKKGADYLAGFEGIFEVPYTNAVAITTDINPKTDAFKKFLLPKASSVAFKNGELVITKQVGNDAGLKLSYTKKTGAVTGSVSVFCAYTDQKKGTPKMKKLTAKLYGVMVDEGLRMTGTMLLPNVGTLPFDIEANGAEEE